MLQTARYNPPTRVAKVDPLAYAPQSAFDEMAVLPGQMREPYRALAAALAEMQPSDLARLRDAAESAFLMQGITFQLQGAADDRVLPFDIVPRILTSAEWQVLERGLNQRLEALNRFLHDVYHDERIIKDGVVPRELIYTSKHYVRHMRGVDLPDGTYVAIAGNDLIRDREGRFVVLEDNLRVPSGVSYMLSNRHVLQRLLPSLLRRHRVLPIEHYPQMLLQTLTELAPAHRDNPTIVILTPGPYNSAYFEHAFLARQMGLELVLGRDLVAHDNLLYMRTTAGLKQVDVIYRRVDDDFLDPLAFRPDSLLGVPGLFNVYRAGNVAIANAVGTGIADDKAVYAYVPAMIKYYLGEDAILPNVETFLGWRSTECQHILGNLEKLVVKAVGEAGGYGMLIGPHSTAAQRENFAQRVKANPRNYIAQPTIDFSTAPCLIGDGLSPRHVDLRPFVLTGKARRIVPGGLTRVALKAGSLVVNSSQGGGSKDTWVLAGEAVD